MARVKNSPPGVPPHTFSGKEERGKGGGEGAGEGEKGMGGIGGGGGPGVFLFWAGRWVNLFYAIIPLGKKKLCSSYVPVQRGKNCMTRSNPMLTMLGSNIIDPRIIQLDCSFRISGY